VKKCIVVSTPDAKFLALAFKEDFKDSIKKIAYLGFDAVELAVRDPGNIDITKVKNALKKYNLPVPAIGTGQAYGQEGLSLTDPDILIRQKAVQRIKDQMNFSAEIGRAQVIIGLIRGNVKPDMDKEKAEKHFICCIRDCADYNPEITLTLEPINRYETNLYNDTASMREIIDKIKRPNVKMLIDTFHMNIEEPDINKSIIKVKDYISHVHIADSNRWAPGCGHINFNEILNTLKEIKYDKAISAEILPKPTPDKSANLTIDYYRKLGL
jgi:5-keto-L-gluconate epimerase